MIDATAVFEWMGTPSPTPAAVESMTKVVDAVLVSIARTHTAPTAPGTTAGSYGHGPYGDAPYGGTPATTAAVDADWDLGLTMQCARLWKRKSSPEGVIANSEFGAIRVTRFDADIEQMLAPFLNFHFA